MFVQMIEGRVSDRERLHRQMDQWQSDLRPGATGFLGSTGGVTDDGYGITFARFESAAAATANSERPEQGRWWAETEKCFAGDVAFTDSEDVETTLRGGSNDAGFVQIMRGNADRDELHAVDAGFEEVAGSWRPDLIGGLLQVGHLDDRVTATTDVHADPSALAVADGTLWVANAGDDVLSRLPTSTPNAAGRQ